MARKTKEDAEATRSRLLDAAESVFYAKGVAGASLADVAQAAGMTRGAIYWHFKDKVDLFQAMMARVTLPLEQALGALPSQSSPSFSLNGVLSVLVMVMDEVAVNAQMRKVFEIALFKMEHVGDMESVRERRIAANARLRSVVEQALLDWEKAQGVKLNSECKLIAEGLCGMFDGLVYAWLLRSGDTENLADIGRSVLGGYLRGEGISVNFEKNREFFLSPL